MIFRTSGMRRSLERRARSSSSQCRSGATHCSDETSGQCAKTMSGDTGAEQNPVEVAHSQALLCSLNPKARLMAARVPGCTP
jgi:hypothetical protein